MVLWASCSCRGKVHRQNNQDITRDAQTLKWAPLAPFPLKTCMHTLFSPRSLQSPKAVLGNRFIVVEMSDVNLQPVDHNYVDTSAEGAGAAVAAAAQLAAAQQAAAQVAEEAAEVEVAMQVKAAAAYAARKAAHDQAIVSLVLVYFEGGTGEEHTHALHVALVRPLTECARDEDGAVLAENDVVEFVFLVMVVTREGWQVVSWLCVFRRCRHCISC